MEALAVPAVTLPGSVRKVTAHMRPSQLLGWTWAQRTGLLRKEKWFAMLPGQRGYTGPLPTYLDAVNVLHGAAGLPAELDNTDQ